MFSIKFIYTLAFASGSLLAGAVLAPAATYHVDMQAGRDTAPGTSSAPWQHCPGMAAYAGPGILQPGDTVYFNRTQTWPLSGQQGLALAGGVTYDGQTRAKAWATSTCATTC